MAKLRINGDTSGYVDITVPNVAGNTTMDITAPNFSGAITQKTASLGGSIVMPGTSQQSGYLAFTNPSGVRQGYVGWLGSVSQGMEIATDAATNMSIKFLTNGSEKAKIDENGRFFMPNQPTFFASPTNTAGSGVATTFGNLSNNGFTIVSSSRITVPITGAYFISFTTISNNSSVRVDANIWLNGAEFVNMLSEDSTAGYHYRSASVVRRLSANDYIQFNNNNWYNATNTGVEPWRTCSIIFLG